MSASSPSGPSTAGPAEQPWQAVVDAEPLRTLLSHASDVTGITDADGKLVWLSPSIEDMTGYPPEALLGTTPDWLVHPEDLPAFAAIALAAPAAGSPPIHIRLRHRDGTVRDVEAFVTNVVDDPSLGGLLIHARTLTEQTSSVARTADEVFDLFASSQKVGIIFTDADACVTFVNDRWLEITGIAREDAHGRCWLDAVHPDDLDAFIANARAHLSHGGIASFEHRVRQPDGATVRVSGRAFVVHGTAGEVLGHVTTLEDVTSEWDAPGRDARLGALVQRAHDMVSIYDISGGFVYASPSHERVLGYSPEELLGTSPIDLLHPDELDAVGWAFYRQVIEGEPPAAVQHRLRHKDGSWLYVEAIAVNLIDDPAIGGILVNARDVTDRREAEQLSTEQGQILEAIARSAPLRETLEAVVALVESRMPGAAGAIGVVDETDQTFRIITAPTMSPACHAALDGYPLGPSNRPDYKPNFVVATVGLDVRRPETPAQIRACGYRSFWAGEMRHADGEGRLGGVMVLRPDERQPTDTEQRLVALAADLAAIAIDRDRSQTRLAHQASHDALTGLPNREVVLDRLRDTGRGPRRGGPVTALLFLDIDRFKVLNDSVGHDAGDKLLVEMGARLQAALRPGDLVARFGGDEFVMVCEGIDGASAAYDVAGRVLDVVRRPFTVAGSELVVTASIGIAIVDGRPPEELLRDADAAMYWAKERGRARAELFDDQLRGRVVARLDTERDLREAVDRGSFELHYQPVVEIATGALAGFEALLRWPHPTRGLLEPDVFLGVAEETGLMRPIGSWVRREAFGQVAKWRAAHPEWGDFITSVNLSAAELVDPQLGANIEQAIRDAGVDARVLAVEITERILFEDPAAARVLLAQLRALGVYLGLDDFGTGQSPLLHLKEFPIHALKIDCAFVGGLGKDRFDDAIVDAVVGLAQRLDLLAIAEGIETPEQAEYLRVAGCYLGQGRFFAPPLPADEAERVCLTGIVSPDRDD